MNLDWFRDLEHLAETGSFSQAARLSNLSQPALSRRIKAMETRIGAALVDRTHHPVRLTAAGVQILEAGQQARTRLDIECKHIREAQVRPDRQVLTFATQHSIGWRYYPAWLQALENVHGPILSRLRADDLPNCLQDLMAGAVDFVIAYESRQVSASSGSRELDGIRIGHDALIPVSKRAGEGHPLFDLDRKDVTIPYLRFGPTAPIGQHIEPLLAANRLKSRLQVVYENSMAGALRIRVHEGIGIAWLPKSLVSPDIDAGHVVQVGGAKWEVALDIKLFRNRQHRNAMSDQIWDFLERRKDAPLLGRV